MSKQKFLESKFILTIAEEKQSQWCGARLGHVQLWDLWNRVQRSKCAWHSLVSCHEPTLTYHSSYCRYFKKLHFQARTKARQDCTEACKSKHRFLRQRLRERGKTDKMPISLMKSRYHQIKVLSLKTKLIHEFDHQYPSVIRGGGVCEDTQ